MLQHYLACILMLPVCSSAIQDYAEANDMTVAQVFQLESSSTASSIATMLQEVWTVGTGVIVLCM